MTLNLVQKIQMGIDNEMGCHLYPDECEIVLKALIALEREKKREQNEDIIKRERRG